MLLTPSWPFLAQVHLLLVLAWHGWGPQRTPQLFSHPTGCTPTCPTAPAGPLPICSTPHLRASGTHEEKARQESLKGAEGLAGADVAREPPEVPWPACPEDPESEGQCGRHHVHTHMAS